MKITTEESRGEEWECDCCGLLYDETYSVYLDDILVYEYFTDNHMYSSYFPDDVSLVGALLSAIEESLLATTQEAFSEERRGEYNIKYPGNGVGRNQKSWKDCGDVSLDYIKEAMAQVREIVSANVPSDENLQIQLIILWMKDLGYNMEFEEK